ncbi:P-loop containing nucleoside triphosphate hydrolase protein [Chytriomyces sp. MP71]|nr:P-loop containing nucleoside triphosphate hydrolase protein [Chytriomyces sp. MP71]
MGDNDNLNSVASFPRAELRRLLIQAQLDNAFLRASSPELDSAVITQSLRAFPLLASTDVVLPLGSYVGGILYPFGVSFLLPWFVMNLVKEKEAKILAMLKMNGISVILYSMSQFLTFFTIYLLSAIVFYVSGYVARLQMFVLTSPGVLIILLFVWGMVLVAMSLIASILFQQSSLASAFAFLVVLSSVVASMALDNIYSSMAKYPLALLVLWPPFAFYRALAVINRASYMKNRTPYTILALSGNDEVLRCIFILLAHSLLIPAFYLMAESFPTTDALLSVFLDTTDSKRRSLLLKRLSFNLSFTSREDVDVTQERRRVFECAVDLACDSPLVVQHLKKDYRTGYKTSQAALKGVTFAVEKGVVFGLLGPNGAGKSTLLSILTGSNQATSGMVWVNDMNLDSSRHQIQTCIGVCPQHDIFWGSLTVYEHLLFYARIKGVDKRYEKESVNKLISQVQLDRVAHSATKNLSGGERRRLSIAIAVSGSPKLVFLDEPTTGLDPDVKREIWRIIKDLKAERTIILTTHSMQEADACCNRIAIMSQGKLRCLGTHYRLKEVYGAGFKLKFAVGTLSLAERAQKFVESVLPVNEWSLAHELNSHYVYEFNPVKGSVVQLMKAIEARSKEFGITDW